MYLSGFNLPLFYKMILVTQHTWQECFSTCDCLDSYDKDISKQLSASLLYEGMVLLQSRRNVIFTDKRNKDNGIEKLNKFCLRCNKVTS